MIPLLLIENTFLTLHLPSETIAIYYWISKVKLQSTESKQREILVAAVVTDVVSVCQT